MVWTDDRIDRLKTLFADGLSGSQMAADLGVTRNAVIGKLHRIGLRREQTYKAGGPRPPRPRASRPPRLKAEPRLPRKPPKWNPKTRIVDNINLQPEPIPMPEFVDNIIPVGQRKTLLELKEDSCRWPIGDPGTKDFFFCGGVSVSGLPYCKYHCRVAYQPAPARRARPYHGSENRDRAA